MAAPIRQHIRSNVVGYIALFCFVAGGTAIAGENKVEKAKRNSVVSSSIANGAVKKKDLGDDSVTGAKVVDGSLTSADLDFDLGAAGGDLAGSYPNPTLRSGAVDGGAGGDIADGTITGADVNPSSALRFEQTGGGVSRSAEIDATGLRGSAMAGLGGRAWRLNMDGLEVAAGPAIGRAEYGPGTITFGETDSFGPLQSNEVALLARHGDDATELVAVFGDGTEVVLASGAPAR